MFTKDNKISNALGLEFGGCEWDIERVWTPGG
jgi:hypothetical protein